MAERTTAAEKRTPRFAGLTVSAIALVSRVGALPMLVPGMSGKEQNLASLACWGIRGVLYLLRRSKAEGETHLAAAPATGHG